MTPSSIPRYCSRRELPPYSYVTGLFPHPTRDEQGHSYGRHEAGVRALEEKTYRQNETYGYALDLFNHGYYWEAHEAWEALWHACGRHGSTADFLKGLIKLAAAGVKAREGRAAGVQQHSQRAGQLLTSVLASNLARQGAVFGLQLDEVVHAAAAIAGEADNLVGDGRPNAYRRLPLVLVLISPEPGTEFKSQ